MSLRKSRTKGREDDPLVLQPFPFILAGDLSFHPKNLLYIQWRQEATYSASTAELQTGVSNHGSFGFTFDSRSAGNVCYRVLLKGGKT